MKNLILAFLLLALALSCSAASINVQNAVPADTVWSFSVELPAAGDFDEAEILLDGGSLITLYTRGGKILVDGDSVNETKVLSNAVVGNKVYLSIAAVEKGEHTVKLEVDGEEEASKEVLFFEVLGAEGQDDIQAQLRSLSGSVSSLIEQFNELEENALGEEDRQQLQSSIDELNSRIGSLGQRLQEQQESAGQARAQLDALAEEIQLLGQKTSDLNQTMLATSFFGLGASPQAGLLIIVAIVAALAVALVVKNRERLPFKKSLYSEHSGEQEEPVLFSKQEEEITGEVLEEAQGAKSKGKWAFEAEKAETAEQGKEKRFQLGDLLKKK